MSVEERENSGLTEVRGIESAAFVVTDLLLAGYEPLLCILDVLVILTSKIFQKPAELGMRTCPVITGSSARSPGMRTTAQHFPTSLPSRMRRFRCGAKQTTGNSPWHSSGPAHIGFSEIPHVGCVPIWALNLAFAVKRPRSTPASSPDDRK